MFRRIESISQAAVWDGYSASSSHAPDFGRYNLIHGWNASGKTTLSRVFGLLNGSGVSNLPTGAHARFSVVGSEVLDSRKEQDRGRFPVCIFNRDFIDTNLQREDYTQAPALFVVGEKYQAKQPHIFAIAATIPCGHYVSEDQTEPNRGKRY